MHSFTNLSPPHQHQRRRIGGRDHDVLCSKNSFLTSRFRCTTSSSSPSQFKQHRHIMRRHGELREKTNDEYDYEDTASHADDHDYDDGDYDNPPVPSSSVTRTVANDLDDLAPPPINLSRDSILFSENPSTKSNNAVLDLWRSCKVNLPAVITGHWPWKEDPDFADDNPIGGLYNIAFVRMPVIVVGFVYGKNLLEGYPLVMDIGNGPFEMSPLVVVVVLGLILA